MLNSSLFIRSFHTFARIRSKLHTPTSHPQSINPDSAQILHPVLPPLLHPFNGLFSRTTWISQYQKGSTSLDLYEAKDDGVLGWQWYQVDHMQTICTSIQTDNNTNTSSLIFYRPDALADAQPTASKHVVRKRPVLHKPRGPIRRHQSPFL